MRRRLRLLARCASNRIMGRRAPLIASVKLTYRCNLACRACPFVRQHGSQDRIMTWDKAMASLEELAGLGCPIVVFEGGEPLLWSDGTRSFADIALAAKKLFACVGVTTNGTVSLDVPTDIVWVSIDGTRETHDYLRSGSYDRAMGNILTSAHDRIYVHMTLNSVNAGELETVAALASAMPQVKGLTLQLFYPYHRGEEDLALGPEARRRVLEEALRLKRAGYPILNSAWGLGVMRDNSWRCRQFLLANVETDGRVYTGCYAGHRAEVDCSACGFTPVAEASGAYDLVPGALAAGFRIFA
ncbi:MAG TPA: radical SAM protein [Deltaproteobacteria bacterium]|nr:radical SAM protein [Deltaproteobacteria bacterium]HPP80027.1 radical SAM protein [Deltaproteobacteria bacterium]